MPVVHRQSYGFEGKMCQVEFFLDRRTSLVLSVAAFQNSKLTKKLPSFINTELQYNCQSTCTCIYAGLDLIQKFLHPQVLCPANFYSHPQILTFSSPPPCEFCPFPSFPTIFFMSASPMLDCPSFPFHFCQWDQRNDTTHSMQFPF